jgi:hypothetical protein
LTICTIVWRLSKPCSAAAGLNTRTLANTGQAAPGEGEQGERLGGALLGRGGRQVLVGDPLIEAAGESLGFLRAGSGADGVEPVNAWCQRRCHGPVPRPCGGSRWYACR